MICILFYTAELEYLWSIVIATETPNTSVPPPITSVHTPITSVRLTDAAATAAETTRSKYKKTYQNMVSDSKRFINLLFK